MILQFWLVVILLLIIASVIFVLPFVRTNKNKTSIKKEDRMSRNQLNSDLYAIRLAEIEQDDAQGLIIDKEKIIAELQHNLLDDINETESSIETKKRSLIWLPGLLVLILGSVGMYLSVGGYKEVKKLAHVLDNYKALQSKLFDKSKKTPTKQELKDLALGLRVHLTEKPNDEYAWWVYSRLEMMFGHYGVATDAIDKAYALDSKSIDIRLIYIELKMQSENIDDQNQANKMLRVLLNEDPKDVYAWSLYAFMAVQAKDYKLAISRWKKMLTLVEPHSKKAKVIRDSIVFAEGKLAKKTNEQLVANQRSSQQNSATKVNEKNTVTNNANPQVAAINGYKIKIDVSDAVVIPKNGYLFVFASPVGVAMPVAVIKMKIPLFPVVVSLSDANAMIKGTKLSDYPKLVIKARISPSGNVAHRQGQWEGQSKVLKRIDSHQLTLKISQHL